MKSAAARTGLPLGFLRKCSAAGCPAFERNGRVDLNKLLPWIPKVMESREELPAGFDSWTAYLNSVKAKREDLRLQKERGEAIDINDAAEQARSAESYYFAELDRIEREFPPALAGLSATEISKRLKTFLDDLRQASREKFKIKTQSAKN